MTIIGIAGGTGSGKTTVVKKIANALPPHCAAVVPLDSYYNDTTGMTDEERKAINFDHPDAFDWKLLTEHIKMLKNGQAVEQPTYSYVLSNRLPETVHVEPKPVIILEGIMTLHYKKLRDMMDLKIFVDTDADVRLILNHARAVHRTHKEICRPYHPLGRRQQDRHSYRPYLYRRNRYGSIVSSLMTTSFSFSHWRR